MLDICRGFSCSDVRPGVAFPSLPKRWSRSLTFWLPLPLDDDYTVAMYYLSQTTLQFLRQWKCREPNVMQLLRTLHFVAAYYGFTFTAAHRPGSCNVLADAVSRNCVNTPTLCAQPDKDLHPLSPAVIELVCYLHADCTSDS